MKLRNEGPRNGREASSCAGSRGKRRLPLVRSGAFGTKQFKPGDLVQHPQTVGLPAQQQGADRDWRIDFQALDQLELREIARMCAVQARTARHVIIVGLQQLETVVQSGMTADEIPALQSDQQPMDGGLGPAPEEPHHFAVRWRDAMRFHLGADEFQKFILARWLGPTHDRAP